MDGGRRDGEIGAEKRRREAAGTVVDGGCSLEWSARSERGRSMVRTGRLTGGPSGFDIFLELLKLTQTWKLKKDALHCRKNSQILHAAILGHFEQFFSIVLTSKSQ
jgi:hypothetical protein